MPLYIYPHGRSDVPGIPAAPIIFGIFTVNITGKMTGIMQGNQGHNPADGQHHHKAPIIMVMELIIWVTAWFRVWPRISTSLVIRDNTSPWWLYQIFQRQPVILLVAF